MRSVAPGFVRSFSVGSPVVNRSWIGRWLMKHSAYRRACNVVHHRDFVARDCQDVSPTPTKATSVGVSQTVPPVAHSLDLTFFFFVGVLVRQIV